MLGMTQLVWTPVRVKLHTVKAGQVQLSPENTQQLKRKHEAPVQPSEEERGGAGGGAGEHLGQDREGQGGDQEEAGGGGERVPQQKAGGGAKDDWIWKAGRTFFMIANELPQSCAEDADLSGKQVRLQSVAKF